MDIAWFEDLLSVAEKGHFARAAAARNISQSALTRRIQALERWVGVELLDRSRHPIRLTPAGEAFSGRAREIVARASEARAELREQARSTRARVTIACLHSLALAYIPRLVSRLFDDIGPFEAVVVAETRTINAYLDALKTGRSDLFFCFTNPQVPLGINLDGFPQLWLGDEVFAPFVGGDYEAPDLADPAGPSIAHVRYGATSYLSRIEQQVISGCAFESRLNTVYRASLAESLCSAVGAGMGMGWLPLSIAQRAMGEMRLRLAPQGPRMELAISAFKSAGNDNPVVRAIWESLSQRSEMARLV